MKLSAVDVNSNLKVLVYGESGVGKTVFAAGFPGPILFLDFDGKANSAASFFADEPERLDMIEVVDLTPKGGENPIPKFLEVIKDLNAQEKAGAFKQQTIVLDSLTTFSSALLKHIVKTNPGSKRVLSAQGMQPGMPDYGILKREFARLIPGMLTLDQNIVMLGHVDVKKDESTGEIHRGVLTDGSFGQELPIYFEEVYHAYVKNDKYLAQTQADHKYKCRTQRGLPKEIELKYGSLIKK